MTPHKKRQRYKKSADEIADRLGIPKPETWEEVWRILNENEETTYVYAIVNQEARKVKFGKSVSPGARLRSLQTASGHELKLVCYCKETHDLNEELLHLECGHDRVIGEWFRLTDRTRYWIDQIKERACLLHS